MSIFVRSLLIAGLVLSSAVYGQTKEFNVNDPCIIEDFDDLYGDNPEQTTLGAVYAKITNSYKAGYWYAYDDKSGASVKNGAGEVVDASNVPSLIENNQLHVKLSTSASTATNSYAGVGFNVLIEGDSANLSKMNGITMKVKGSGDSVRFRIETNDIIALNEGWGYYGYNFKPTAQWQTLTIPVASLKPEAYSTPDKKSWTFAHGATGCTKMAFQVKDGKDCELYVDSIVANGITYADLGIKTSVILPKAVRSSSMFSVNAANVSFKLPCAQDITVSLRDITGKQIRTLYAGTASSKTINLNNLNVPNGQYLVMLSGKGLKATQPVVILK
jgi:hypothetical protein